MDRNEAARKEFLEKMKPPVRQIAVAVPSGDEVKANFAMALSAMSYYCGMIQLPLAMFNYKGGHVAQARNELVRQAMEINCEWLFFIDSDMTFPPPTLARLLSHKKSVVGCTYVRRSAPHDNLAVPLGYQPTHHAHGLIEVERLPTGCMLINMDIFKKMKRPYFRFNMVEEDVEKGIPPSTGAEDYYFCDALHRAGEQVWLDVEWSFNITHWGEAGWRCKEESGDPNAPRFEMVELTHAVT